MFLGLGWKRKAEIYLDVVMVGSRWRWLMLRYPLQFFASVYSVVLNKMIDLLHLEKVHEIWLLLICPRFMK